MKLILCRMLVGLGVLSGSVWAASVSPNLSVWSGAVNAVRVGQGEDSVWLYDVADSERASAGRLLLTHGRRDVLPVVSEPFRDWDVTAPVGEREVLERPEAFWESFRTGRFHDYGQQSTKIPARAFPVDRWVDDGEAVSHGNTRLMVVATPGFTRGAVSYVGRIDGQQTAFTGDLIYAGGRVLDLYSFQDAIPEAQIRGYHGYAARFADLVRSLRRLQGLDLDRIVPARGPVIDDPDMAIEQLIQRAQNVYRNYLSTNALNWYFKEDRMRLSGRRVLGESAEVQLMSYSTHLETPGWILSQSTSRVVVSDEGHGWLLDCGGKGVIDAVEQWVRRGLLRDIEGIFVTHYHDDHTDSVQAAAERFDCPVYALNSYEDILEKPAAYHMPAMTANAIADVTGVPDGHRMRWREFEFTFHEYPGQAFYHGALMVEKPGEDRIFFVGDSFSPSGMDDYCLLNRNLIADNQGYFQCLKKLRAIEGDYWLINEHIPHIFRFSDVELGYLEHRYQERREQIAELIPWDAPNYGVDEQWAFFYPYGAKVAPGAKHELEVRITNHSPAKRRFEVRLRGAPGLAVPESAVAIDLAAGASGRVPYSIQAPGAKGLHLVTADVVSEGMTFRNWIESMVEVE